MKTVNRPKGENTEQTSIKNRVTQIFTGVYFFCLLEYLLLYDLYLGNSKYTVRIEQNETNTPNRMTSKVKITHFK